MKLARQVRRARVAATTRATAERRRQEAEARRYRRSFETQSTPESRLAARAIWQVLAGRELRRFLTKGVHCVELLDGVEDPRHPELRWSILWLGDRAVHIWVRGPDIDTEFAVSSAVALAARVPAPLMLRLEQRVHGEKIWELIRATLESELRLTRALRRRGGKAEGMDEDDVPF